MADTDFKDLKNKQNFAEVAKSVASKEPTTLEAETLPNPGNLATQFCERDLMKLQIHQEKKEKLEAQFMTAQLQVRVLRLDLQEAEKVYSELINNLWTKYWMTPEDSVDRNTGVISRRNAPTPPSSS